MPGMKWDEFKDLLHGLNEKTPLGRVVTIRSETDREILKTFGKHEHKIRREWRAKQAGAVTADRQEQALKAIQNAFKEMAGGSD